MHHPIKNYAVELSDEAVRKVKAAAMGLTLRDYETSLRGIGVNYENPEEYYDET